MHTINKELTAYMVTTPTNKNGTSNCDPPKTPPKKASQKRLPLAQPLLKVVLVHQEIIVFYKKNDLITNL